MVSDFHEIFTQYTVHISPSSHNDLTNVLQENS